MTVSSVRRFFEKAGNGTRGIHYFAAAIKSAGATSAMRKHGLAALLASRDGQYLERKMSRALMLIRMCSAMSGKTHKNS